MRKILWLLFVCCVSLNGFGMSKSAHINGFDDIAGIKDLLGKTVVKNGTKSITLDKAVKINDWMDNPATKIGKYKNLKAGGKIVHPLNHGNLRHNPFKVAKVFSGSGKINGAALNIARLHKIQDVYNNKALVDGFKSTLKMKKEAGTILRYARRFKSLPLKKLPQWVDQSGPLLTGTKNLESSSILLVGKTAKFVKMGKVLKTAGKYALPISFAIEGGLLGYNIYDVERSFKMGNIDMYKRNELHGENIGASAGSMAALACGVAIFAVTPAGPVVLIAIGGVIVGTYVLDYTGKIVGKFIAEKYNSYLKENEKYFVSLYSTFFSCIERCNLSNIELKACGFTDFEIKAINQL